MSKRKKAPTSWLQEIETTTEQAPVEATPAAPPTEGVKVEWTAASSEEDVLSVEEALDTLPLPEPPSTWEMFVTPLPKHVVRDMLHAGLCSFEDCQAARAYDLLVPNGPFTRDSLETLKAALAAKGISLKEDVPPIVATQAAPADEEGTLLLPIAEASSEIIAAHQTWLRQRQRMLL